jgi:uncharacterized membrane protein YtjA (UPF0391 family)
LACHRARRRNFEAVKSWPSTCTVKGGWKERYGYMLRYALIFLVIAILAAILGFAGIAVAAAGIAKILFLIFLVLFLVTLVMHVGRRV